MTKIYRVFGLMAAALLMACSDDLYDVVGSSSAPAGQLAFTVSTTEMDDLLVAVGQTTRAAADTAATADTRRSDIFREHKLTGDNPYDLRVHSLPMPAVGIHRGAVRASSPSTATDGATRTLGQVITGDANFHDSITIWGYTDNPYTNENKATEKEVLFRQILLKKIRNWRSDVHWPYDLKGTQMTFYAVAPSMEGLDLTVSDNNADFTTPPVFSYTLPDNIYEMVDLLYGISSPQRIDIQAGPSGSVTTNPREENIGKDNKMIDLTFNHILTAVRFSKGVIPAGITVKAIQLVNVPTSGTFDPSLQDAYTGTAGAWSAQSSSRTFTLSTSFTGGTTGDYIDGGRILFMIPQRLTAASSLNIRIAEEGGKEHILSCSLDRDEWKKGYTVNYQITVGRVSDQYVLTVDAPAAHEHSTSRTYGSFTLHSYHNYKDYSAGSTPTDYHHPVEWKVVGYSADGTNFYEDKNSSSHAKSLDWLERIDGTTSTAGGNAVTVNYTLLGQTPASTINHENILSSNSTDTQHQASNWDLSTQTPNGADKTTAETANCYIVNRRGSYEFPLIYGNKTAYGDEDACFKDHKGAVISNMIIKDQIKAKNPGDDVYVDDDKTHRHRTSYTWEAASNSKEYSLMAEVVWQDVDGLIGSVSTTSDYISFTVSKDEPGNAVIALKGRQVTTYKVKNGSDEWVLDTSKGDRKDGYVYGPWETFWTWHIWMTDEVYENVNLATTDEDPLFLNWDSTNKNHLVSITNFSSATNTILPVNLGWVPDNPEYSLYKPREVWVKLQQTKPEVGTPNTVTVKIRQEARQPLYTGTGTVYQWGRPTAFPSVRHIDATTRTIYDGKGNIITDNFVLAQHTDKGDPIAEPYKILRLETEQNSWFPVNTYTNGLWRTDKKTVYDPCPPGFQMPSYDIFSGFSRTGTEAKDGTGLNILPDAEGQKSAEQRKGGYFFTSKYVDEASVKRDNPVVYMPATGEYHGNKISPPDLKMSDPTSYFDYQFGIYWAADYEKADNSKAPALWLVPDWEYVGTLDSSVSEGKPAYKAKRIDCYSSLRQVRPVEAK